MRLSLWLCAAGILACAASCAATRTAKIRLPARHSIESEQLLVVSDFKLSRDHELIKDLMQLREDVSEVLEIPLGKKQVMVYLFSNELEYNQYFDHTYPNYPKRRAYFIQTPGKQLAVYTWWGEKIQEDLRHEFTHGLLHASLQTVPLWLDEGLAEYFEVAGPATGQINVEHAHTLAKSLQNGWRPDMERLERLEKVDQMQRADYRESWAWVHFMLHGSPETRDVLLSYIHDLRHTAQPGSLRERLTAEIPDVDMRLLSYVGGLNSFAPWMATHPQSARPVSAGNY
jgi:hypothetical protein